MYEIIDNDGVIHSSNDYNSIVTAFDCMRMDVHTLINNEYAKTRKEATKLQEKWYVPWKGDLKLIKVLRREK